MGQSRYSWSYLWWSGFPPTLPHTRRPGDPRWASLVTHGPIGGGVASLTPTPHKEDPEILGGPVSLLMVLLVVEWLPSPLYPTQGGPEILGGPVSLLMVLLVVEWLPLPLLHTRRPGDPRWASLVTHGPAGGGVASLTPYSTQGGPEILGGPVSLLMVLLVVEWLPSHPYPTQGGPEILGGPVSLLMVLLVVEWLPFTPTPHKEARRS